MKKTLIILGLILAVSFFTLFNVSINSRLGGDTSVLLIFFFTNALYFLVDKKPEVVICIFSFGLLGAIQNIALLHGVLTFPIIYFIHRKSILETGRKARFFNLPAESVAPFINEYKDNKLSSWDIGLILVSVFQGVILISIGY